MNSFSNSLQFQKSDINEIEDQIESLSEFFSIINDLICDEYSVYQMNLTYFENSSDISLKIENYFCLLLKQKIEHCLNYGKSWIFNQ